LGPKKRQDRLLELFYPMSPHSACMSHIALTQQKVITLHLEPFKSSKLPEHHVQIGL